MRPKDLILENQERDVNQYVIRFNFEIDFRRLMK